MPARQLFQIRIRRRQQLGGGLPAMRVLIAASARRQLDCIVLGAAIPDDGLSGHRRRSFGRCSRRRSGGSSGQSSIHIKVWCRGRAHSFLPPLTLYRCSLGWRSAGYARLGRAGQGFVRLHTLLLIRLRRRRCAWLLGRCRCRGLGSIWIGLGWLSLATRLLILSNAQPRPPQDQRHCRHEFEACFHARSFAPECHRAINSQSRFAPPPVAGAAGMLFPSLLAIRNPPLRSATA